MSFIRDHYDSPALISLRRIRDRYKDHKRGLGYIIVGICCAAFIAISIVFGASDYPRTVVICCASLVVVLLIGIGAVTYGYWDA